ncbi:MAG: SET domain-containing protein-lysine N-methyltransferase [Candidatus Diapherotrites archaeon]|uniref:SET domain-containing protein-lysine N-methyltransferase n=1 Tax=Candidatus Iainarchaeum sp. TaxID=3101447 RepID=A0A8T4L439_9ARCH|nr:SET domain-containing protein-lysine N-methyltransferase [Candidatus Diapherotrites archaeon]
MTQEFVVHKSVIHGKGVFALRDFKPGEIVIHWDTTRQISRAQFDQLPENEKAFIATYKGKLIVQQAPAKFVNHSCDPNTRVKNFCDTAIKPIKKGDEITTDYRDDPGSELDMSCNCQTQNCTGRIKGKKQTV